MEFNQHEYNKVILSAINTLTDVQLKHAAHIDRIWGAHCRFVEGLCKVLGKLEGVEPQDDAPNTARDIDAIKKVVAEVAELQRLYDLEAGPGPA
jgi:hypothetical protein